MSGDFLDSNVILYTFDVDEQKRLVAQGIVMAALAGDACISFQVVQEVLNLLTRRRQPLASEAEARRALTDVLMPLWRVMPSQGLYERALGAQARYGYGFYDSLIIAAALESGCRRLLSEDLQHGQRIEGLTIENPFRGVASG